MASAAFFVIDGVADLDRQIGKDRAGLGALDAFDADVLHDERRDRPGEIRGDDQHERERRDGGLAARGRHLAESLGCRCAPC